MLLLILFYIIQALLIVHVIKTGRNQLWIWVLLLAPTGSRGRRGSRWGVGSRA